MTEPGITHLERRKIEAGVLIPMIQAFQRAIGLERANEIAREVIRELARRDGERWAQQFGDDLAAMEKVSGVWARGGALEIRPFRRSAEKLDFNVTRCRYAEFYKELGLPELVPVSLQSRLRDGRGFQPRHHIDTDADDHGGRESLRLSIPAEGVTQRTGVIDIA